MYSLKSFASFYTKLQYSGVHSLLYQAMETFLGRKQFSFSYYTEADGFI